MLTKYIQNKISEAQELMQNNSEEALKIFDEILEIEPRNIDALNGKGSTLMKMNKLNEAEKCFEKSLSLNENSAALLNKGIILKNKEKYDEALEYYEKAVKNNVKLENIVRILKNEIFEINTDNSNLKLNNYTNKANEYIEKGLEFKNDKKLWDALYCYEQAISEDYTSKSYVLTLINDIKIILMREFIFNTPEFNNTKLDHLKIQSLRAFLIEENAKKALTLMNLILEIDEKDLDILNHKGTILFYFDECNDAVNIFDKCLEIDENYYYALFNKGLVLRKMNNLECALKCFDKLLTKPELEKKVKPYQLEILDKLHEKNKKDKD